MLELAVIPRRRRLLFIFPLASSLDRNKKASPATPLRSAPYRIVGLQLEEWKLNEKKNYFCFDKRRVHEKNPRLLIILQLLKRFRGEESFFFYFFPKNAFSVPCGKIIRLSVPRISLSLAFYSNENIWQW